MSAESFDGGSIAPGAVFVASAGGEEYYWVGSQEWRRIPPPERVWFATEAAAQSAGYRGSTSACLDEFEIVGELGRGGTSIVYHARDRTLGRDVAIKVIQASFGDDSETVARFAQEARLLARLRHPNIVSAFSVKQLEGGGLALVMEYVAGRTLREVVGEEGPLASDRAEEILYQVADALAAAHRHGIVHRDVKPDNIFLEETSGRALLADFGIAMHLDRPTGLTMAGAAVGTPNYMSPEQIDGYRVDGRSDLYSLAMIGWEMLTGRQPWAGESLYNVIYRQKHDELPSVRSMRPDVPARLTFAIEVALAKDPNARWSGVEEFLRHLGDESLTARWRQQQFETLPRKGQIGAHAPGAPVEPSAPDDVKTMLFRRGEQPERSPAIVAPVPVATPVRRGRSWRRALVAAAVVAVGLTAIATPLRQTGRVSDTEGLRTGAEIAFSSQEILPRIDGPAAGGARPGRDTPMAGTSREVNGEAADQGEPGGEVPVLTGLDDLPLEGTAPVDEAGAISEADPRDAAAGLPTEPLPATTDSLAAATAELLSATPDSPAAAAADSTGPAVAVSSLGLPVWRDASRIAAGGLHTCQIDARGGTVCWGGNDSGQLGTGDRSRVAAALRVEGASGFQSVVAGGFHSCALSVAGTALCWGANGDGQLGAGRGELSSPVRIEGVRFYSLSPGSAHTCGVGRDEQAYCWGSNTNGQLGDGTNATRAQPAAVPLPGSAASVVAGWNHTCALTRDGRAFCWGQNHRGQLGVGGTTGQAAPVRVAGAVLFRSITAGSAHTCGLTIDGEAYCWGENSDGRLGDGTTTDRTEPTSVRTGVRFVEIAAGGRHTCGIAASGATFCWGQNNYGQLGTGDADPRLVPGEVDVDVRFAAIRSTGSHTCGVAADGTSYCWGYNIEGQVGDGSQAHRTRPQRVAF